MLSELLHILPTSLTHYGEQSAMGSRSGDEEQGRFLNPSECTLKGTLWLTGRCVAGRDTEEGRRWQ